MWLLLLLLLVMFFVVTFIPRDKLDTHQRFQLSMVLLVLILFFLWLSGAFLAPVSF